MENKVTIKIKYLSKDIDDLKYIDGKSGLTCVLRKRLR